MLRSVSTAERDHREKAIGSLLRADAVSQKKTDDFLGAIELQNVQEHKLTVLAGECYRIAGENYDSASAYGKAAALSSQAMNDRTLAAHLYTEAAHMMEKIDCNFANQYYHKAISHHCDASQYNDAAKIEEHIGNNFCQKQDFEASISHYQRASKLYNAIENVDGSDRTLERAGRNLAKVNRVQESASTYQSLAICQAKQQLKKLNVPKLMLRAGILLLSESLHQTELDFSEVREMVETISKIDCRFESSREHKFLVDILQCVVRGDLDKFVDNMFSYNCVSEFDDIMIFALEKIKDAIVGRSKSQAAEEK